MPYSLLVIDDQDSILHAFRRAFRSTECTLTTAANGVEGIKAARELKPNVIVLDVHLPDASGLEVFQTIHDLDARIPIIMMTGHGTTELAIEAMKRGAYEYLLKPVELPALRELVEAAAASSRRMHTPAVIAEVESAPERADVLIGRCPAMQEVYKAIGKVARQDVTVLILGETGTGKELVARAIYQHSRRADKEFLAINCAAIPDNLLESEIFGHERGAFTGADRKRIGKFEQCNGGTLFLDEVGDMSPLTQTKILRVLQDQVFERVGGNEEVRTDVRLIAATNADLESLVADSQFRGDLYFRLKIFTIHLPPLRERGDDFDVLLRHYVRRYAKELEIEVDAIAPETLEILRAYRWPGNVRELQSVIKQSILHMRGRVILPEALPGNLTSDAPGGATNPSPAPDFDWARFVADRIAAGSESLYNEAQELMEREVLTRVLQHTNGNQLQAARILGINRGSLRTKIKSLNIRIDRTIWSDSDQDD
jgi:nitrogen regulation protein NR(I)